MRKQLILTAMVIVLAGTAPSLADEKHGKDKSLAFASLSVGIKTLDEFIVEARSKIGKGDFAGLPETAEELEETAAGLSNRISDVSAENRERFRFNTDQIKSLSGQLEKTGDSKSAEDAEKIAKKLEAVRDRLKALLPAG